MVKCSHCAQIEANPARDWTPHSMSADSPSRSTISKNMDFFECHECGTRWTRTVDNGTGAVEWKERE